MPATGGEVREAILDEFDEYLPCNAVGRRTPVKAYLGDLRSLFAFLADRGSSLTH